MNRAGGVVRPHSGPRYVLRPQKPLLILPFQSPREQWCTSNDVRRVPSKYRGGMKRTTKRGRMGSTRRGMTGTAAMSKEVDDDRDRKYGRENGEQGRRCGAPTLRPQVRSFPSSPPPTNHPRLSRCLATRSTGACTLLPSRYRIRGECGRRVVRMARRAARR
jgi:hypothetical protein